MTIIYIAGLGHSGSTFFSRVLNQHPDIFAAGEIVNFYQEKDTDEFSCSCLMKSSENQKNINYCSFWPEIYRKVKKSELPAKNISRIATNRQLEWIKAITGSVSSNRMNLFKRGNLFLFETLKNKSGCSNIVDSSKTPWRLLPLSRVLDNDQLKILHLLKSPRNQIESNLSRGYSFWDGAIQKYLRKNVIISAYFRDKPNYRKVKFEALVEQPTKVMKRVFRWLDLSIMNPFDNPPQEAHHLRGHIESYMDHLEVRKIPKPNPDRLSKYDMSFNFVQRLIIKFLKRQIYG